MCLLCTDGFCMRIILFTKKNMPKTAEILSSFLDKPNIDAEHIHWKNGTKKWRGFFSHQFEFASVHGKILETAIAETGNDEIQTVQLVEHDAARKHVRVEIDHRRAFPVRRLQEDQIHLPRGGDNQLGRVSFGQRADIHSGHLIVQLNFLH